MKNLFYLTNYFTLFMQGISVTVAAWCIAGAISLCLGTLLGFASCAYFNFTRTQQVIKVYTFIAKGIPAYVQILIAYFVLPSLLQIHISGFVAATGALAFCSSGYITEIVRSGINTISLGQWEASYVLGYPTSTAIKRIILPQLKCISLPAIAGELEQLLKSTTLLATIGVTDITRVGINIISRELNPLTIYCVIAIIYLLLSALLAYIMQYIQTKKLL